MNQNFGAIIGKLARPVGLLTLSAVLVGFAVSVFGQNVSYTVGVVAAGGTLLGILSGVVGCFAVLRRQSLLGDTISHAALPGVAIAFLLVGRQLPWLMLGAGISAWLGVVFIRRLTATTRIKTDAAMGIVLAGWFALGISLLTYIQTLPEASQAGLDSFIFGQAAAIVAQDLVLMGLVAGLAIILVFAFWKELKLLVFDEVFARVAGIRVGLVNLILTLLIIVAIIIGLQMAGVILMVGMLIAPAIAARQWTNRLEVMVVLAGFFGAFAGASGAVLSAIDSSVPTGPMMILSASAIVAVSLLFAPQRGLIWRRLRRRSDDRRFAVQNTLRCLYKYSIDHGQACFEVDQDFITGVVGRGSLQGLKHLEKDGLVQRKGDFLCLSESGQAAATRDYQSLLLWDIYRRNFDQIPAANAHSTIQEERYRDIHEVLDEATVAQLQALAADKKNTTGGLLG